MVKIGHNTTSELWNINFKRMHRFMKNVIPFVNASGKCADMGEANPKMEYLKEQLGLDVEQIDDIDFNFGFIDGKYDNIFCFEVMEHLQNPMFCMWAMKVALKSYGSIYVTMPCNPRWLWVDGHYFEIPPQHFEKWIVEPLGLKIVRHKRFYFWSDWRIIGIRPIIRVLKGKEHWKSLFRKALYFKFDIYEIKRNNI